MIGRGFWPSLSCSASQLGAVLLSVILLSACEADKADSKPPQVAENLPAQIDCKISMVHLCTDKHCESVPVYFNPQQAWPLHVDLQSGEVTSLYDSGNMHRSQVLNVQALPERIVILGKAEVSHFDNRPMGWLMQVAYADGRMILSGTGPQQGVVIFGQCRIGKD